LPLLARQAETVPIPGRDAADGVVTSRNSVTPPARLPRADMQALGIRLK
jgi:hypothetical protein